MLQTHTGYFRENNMLDAAKEAITDRIKTPIIGTYLLFFTFVNYLQFHPLIVNFKSIEKTQEAFRTLDVNLWTPAGYTLIFVLISAIIKVANRNWDGLIELVIQNTLDKLSKLHFRYNLIEIAKLQNKMAKRDEELIRSRSLFEEARLLTHSCLSMLYLESDQEQVVENEECNSKKVMSIKEKHQAYQFSKNAFWKLSMGINYMERGVDGMFSEETLSGAGSRRFPQAEDPIKAETLISTCDGIKTPEEIYKNDEE